MDGSVLSHLERKAPRVRSSGDPQLIRAVTAHVEMHLGPVEHVLHDLDSDVVHVDLLWVRPGPDAKFHTFVTCGMSERPMQPPRCARRLRRAELLLRLPTTWNTGLDLLGAESSHWPLRELEQLARMPHLYETWLWAEHTVANGDPPARITDSAPFCGSLLLPAGWTPRAFRKLRRSRRDTIHFFSVILLYAEELLLAREAGAARLVRALEDAGVTDLLDPSRPAVVTGGRVPRK
jgi:hypothetical protein